MIESLYLIITRTKGGYTLPLKRYAYGLVGLAVILYGYYYMLSIAGII